MHWLHPIEYIGPPPKKKTRRKPLSGVLVMLGITCLGLFFVLKPFVEQLLAQEVRGGKEDVSKLVKALEKKETFGARLAAAALLRTQEAVVYDPSYYKIGYPMGDIPSGRGVCSDVIIRAYRHLGIDLQKEVHKDMLGAFYQYPQLWGLDAPDSNIDHRRVPNLQRFFVRHGAEVAHEKSLSHKDFQVGDVVVWRLPQGKAHIGIVVPAPPDQSPSTLWVVHNIGSGPRWEDRLFEYTIVGYYRYSGKKEVMNISTFSR